MINMNNRRATLISILIFAIFVMLLVRNAGIYTVVSSDESLYSKSARLISPDNSVISNYIYLTIFGKTNNCGSQFYGCAKILNSLFFVAAAPFIYMTAMRFCSASLSAAIALLTLLGPINTYTSYFMPEALYFFCFWVLTWFVLQLDGSSKIVYWILGGIIIGSCALVKPHAILMMPAFVLYIFYVNMKNSNRFPIRAIFSAAAFVIAAFIAKLLIGYLLVGNAGLSIFGDFYSSIARSQVRDARHYVELMELTAVNAIGHILSIVLLNGLAVAVILAYTFRSLFAKEEINSNQNLFFFSFVVLFNLVIVTALFTASVVNTGPHETIDRLHMRYYNFALPLLFIVGASQLAESKTELSFRRKVIGAFPVGSGVLYAIYSRLSPYEFNFVDSPHVSGFAYDENVFLILSVLSFMSLIVWVISARRGAFVFVYIFMPIAVVLSSLNLYKQVAYRINPDVYDRAGIFAKQYLPEEEISKLIIVGHEYGFLFRSSFILDNKDVGMIEIPKGSRFNLGNLPAGKDWVLAIGDDILPEDVFFQVPMSGFKLARVTRSDTFDFKRTVWPGVLSSIRGLSQPEDWGTWSSGEVVKFEFSSPLPEKFSIILFAYAFGQNVDKDFLARVGGSSVKFRLGATPEEVNLEFSNPGRLSLITIEIPSPISPKDLGLSDENRKLGIAFLKMKIVQN